MPQSQPPPGHDERRSGDRHFAVFPAHLQRDDGSARTAVIRDISVTGARLLTRAHVETGERVRLSLYIRADESNPVLADGHVVRSERLSPSRSDVWSYEAAVQFDEPLAGLEAELATIESKQASIYGRR